MVSLDKSFTFNFRELSEFIPSSSLVSETDEMDEDTAFTSDDILSHVIEEEVQSTGYVMLIL